MPTTINVNIKGVAICYQKDNLWKVLFPFNDCHVLKVSSKSPTEERFLGSFGRVKGKIEITTNQAPIDSMSTKQFDDEVLNLTKADAPRKTHPKIEKKTDWNDRGVLLTIPNATFDVEHGLKERFPNEVRDLDIFLTDKLTSEKIEGDIGHSVTGRIQLTGDNTVIIKVGADEIFKTTPGGTYFFNFDNDCSKVTAGKNDMEMFYELIKEPDNVNRKFIIEGRPIPIPLEQRDRSDPPDLRRGKPCLVVKVTDLDSIATLP